MAWKTEIMSIQSFALQSHLLIEISPVIENVFNSSSVTQVVISARIRPEGRLELQWHTVSGIHWVKSLLYRFSIFSL